MHMTSITKDEMQKDFFFLNYMKLFQDEDDPNSTESQPLTDVLTPKLSKAQLYVFYVERTVC